MCFKFGVRHAQASGAPAAVHGHLQQQKAQWLDERGADEGKAWNCTAEEAFANSLSKLQPKHETDEHAHARTHARTHACMHVCT